MTYQVQLPVYQGPFELLLDLIKREEVSIWDIPIARITDQYLEYLSVAEVLDLHLAADFLVMAATLIQLKARSLLPRPKAPDPDEPAEPDPREELALRLLDYRRYYLASVRLGELLAAAGRRYPRGVPRPKLEVHYSQPVGSATPELLCRLAADVLAACREREEVKELRRISIDLPARMRAVLSALAREPKRFTDLLARRRSRLDCVVTLLAVLELARKGKVKVRQSRPFGVIELSLGSGDELDARTEGQH
jgi:segregation and condensation protein A